MKVKRLVINNCLGIKEFQMDPGKINIISGGNERGKTSILECIEKAVNNSERRAKFVKTGEEEATLFVSLDDGTEINRKIKPDSETIKVVNNGTKVKKPEAYLKSLVGGFAFNPVDFIQKKDKEQSEILLSLIPLRLTEEMLIKWFGEVPEGIDLNQHAVTVLEFLAERYYYDRRTIANTKEKECGNEIASIAAQLPNNYNADDWRNVVIGEKWKTVEKTKQVNEWIKQANELIGNKDASVTTINNKYDLKVVDVDNILKTRIDNANDKAQIEKTTILNAITSNKDLIQEYLKKIQQLESEIKMDEQKLKNITVNVTAVKVQSLRNERDIEVKAIDEARDKEIQEFNVRVVNASKYLEENEIKDIAPLVAGAEEVEEMKGYIALYDKLIDLRVALITKQATAARFDRFVEIARKKPAELLKNIKLPVTGLGINNEMQITVDALPIRNLSTSRQIKLALDIARATCGPLQLICVDRFESLDVDQQKLFMGEIEKDDFQYFITEVTGGELKIDSQEGK